LTLLRRANLMEKITNSNVLVKRILLSSVLALVASSASAQIIILRPPTYMGQPNPLTPEEQAGNEQRRQEELERKKRALQEELSKPRTETTYSYDYWWSYGDECTGLPRLERALCRQGRRIRGF
jgi:hypothetical protein